MKMAIQFAVRDSAGGLQRGTVTGEEEGNFIQVGAGDSISLNLSVANVVAYTQHGTDLVVTLVDGRAVVLAGYFNPAGGARGLYLSESDEIIEVMLTDSGSGGLLVSYLPIQPTEKWSPLDGLRFAESDITMEGYEVTDESGGMLVPAAALLLGAGVVARMLNGGGADGSGDNPCGSDRIAPFVDNPDAIETLTTNTPDASIRITGGGETGDLVVVAIGTETQTTTIRPDGTWGVTFDRDALPGDGTYSAVVVVTEPGGTEHVLDGPDYIIDMTPPEVAVTQGTQSVGDLENLADYADGITISGVGEIGATVLVEVDGQSQQVVIAAAASDPNSSSGRTFVPLSGGEEQGIWSVNFSQDEVAVLSGLPAGSWRKRFKRVERAWSLGRS